MKLWTQYPIQFQEIESKIHATLINAEHETSPIYCACFWEWWFTFSNIMWTWNVDASFIHTYQCGMVLFVRMAAFFCSALCIIIIFRYMYRYSIVLEYFDRFSVNNSSNSQYFSLRSIAISSNSRCLTSPAIVSISFVEHFQKKRNCVVRHTAGLLVISIKH